MSREIAICHRCDRRSPPPYTGVCLCTVNNRNIIANASEGVCPLNKFRRGLGDWIHFIFKRIGINAIAQWWSRLTKTPCKCGDRQQTLNDEWGKFWEQCGFKPYL